MAREAVWPSDASGRDPIEEHLLDDEEEGRQSIIDAAAEGFEEDQESPASPSRRERSFGVKDPSHSKGSVRHGAGERDVNTET